MTGSPAIAFLYIGGVHHVAHTLPVAAALAMRAGVKVTAFCADAAIEAIVRQVLADFPGADVQVVRLRRFPVVDLFGRPSLSKLPTLWRNRRVLDRFDALLMAERTSLALKRMGVTRPLFLCLPHGAGDRAVSYEPRFKLFDRVLVAGPKTRRGLVGSGVAEERVVTVGYPRAEYLAARARAVPRFFDNDDPIILYNPHFRSKLSSLPRAEEIIRSLAWLPGRNLIVAPHIRAFEGASAAELARWKALEVPGKVLVDTGSEAMIDMSYVRAADLYVGDVSSQVYEFLLLEPRPCLFVNAHGVQWEDDPDYAFWRLGTVVQPEDVRTGVEQAVAGHDRFRSAQEAAVADTFGSLQGSAERGADAILAAVAGSR